MEKPSTTPLNGEFLSEPQEEFIKKGKTTQKHVVKGMSTCNS
jgi:hypothetical protein